MAIIDSLGFGVSENWINPIQFYIKYGKQFSLQKLK